ncbi:hypothetical protein ACFE04_024592 [Oxalis oulophora]
MAGALTMYYPEGADNNIHSNSNSITTISTVNEWQIEFARFFTLPSTPSLLSSASTSLIPLPLNRRYRPIRGTWISTSSQMASLHIVNNSILSVCFRGKILEEHYISKLQFSWPQVSCVSGFPARGSRAVLVSYRDSANEIQKFALRFSTLEEAETFINSLKATLENVTQTEPINSDFRSEISCQSDFMSSNNIFSSVQKEKPTSSTPVYIPQLPRTMNYELEQHSPNPSLLQTMNYELDQHSNTQRATPNPHLRQTMNNELEQHSYTQRATPNPHLRQTMNNELEQHSYTQRLTPNQNIQCISPALPPSFMSLLNNCVPGVKQEKTFGSEEVNLKSEIVRYMEDAAFQDMLCKVEKIINEMGDDMSLKGM